MSQTLVLYAPNVHTGGGLVLLRALLTNWPAAVPLTAFLDDRARDHFILPTDATVSWVRASIGSRLKAELRLSTLVGADPNQVTLCFHGLPPLLTRTSRVVVFLQNRLYLDAKLSSNYRWKTHLRLAFERFVSHAFRRRVSEYIVQTPAMERAVLKWLEPVGWNDTPEVKLIPFVDGLPTNSTTNNKVPKWDFVYVADGEAHKNHRILLAAWLILAKEGLYPSLVLTLGSRDLLLANEIETACRSANLNIVNLGQIPHEDVLVLYTSVRAMVFPSISESFGLPLVEAAHLGLPILASELDFVRDVCVPAETFDPTSAVSIARSIKRFIGKSEAPLMLRTPSEFWRILLQDRNP